MESINLVIVGGAVSLVSALATIIVQHWLNLRKVSPSYAVARK